jgi:hypothetical protein
LLLEVYFNRNYAGRQTFGVGVVNSLARRGCGPVGLIHTQKAGIKYKKPLWFLVSAGVPARRGGSSISGDKSSVDRPHFHSGIFVDDTRYQQANDYTLPAASTVAAGFWEIHLKRNKSKPSNGESRGAAITAPLIVITFLIRPNAGTRRRAVLVV